MSWEVAPPRVVIRVTGEEYDVTNLSPGEIKQKIVELAKEKGLRVFDVYINGKLATPENFERLLEEEKRRAAEVEILIVKRDVAG